MINFQFQPYANGFFSDRDNLDEAFEYAHDVLAALPAEHRMPAYAALYVIINTAARVEREAQTQEQERGRRRQRSSADREDTMTIYKVNS